MTQIYVDKYLAISDNSYMKRTESGREITPDWFLGYGDVVLYPYNKFTIIEHFEYIQLTKPQYMDVILSNYQASLISEDIRLRKGVWKDLKIVKGHEISK